MIAIETSVHEPTGMRHRTRLVSGPQGPHVVIDGKPVLLLCSDNYLGLADHPRVRQAAGEAAMRWGVGAGASRLTSGTMTIHRRLEERLAVFAGRDRALLFGSRLHANAGVIAALARPGDVILCDELAGASILDGCRLSGAEVFLYDHGDVEHLEWAIEEAEGRGALIVTESVFSAGGDLAPLEDIVELASAHSIRVLVDEAHALGAFGPGGRGALAAAGLEEHVDVIVGTLGKALGSFGGFVACDSEMATFLAGTARTFAFATAPAPPAVAGALAALELIEARPRLVDKLAANAVTLREALADEGFQTRRRGTHIVPLLVGDERRTGAMVEAGLQRGVFAHPLAPPAVASRASGVRLTVMASHREAELRLAARALGAAALSAGIEPGSAARDDPEPAGRPVDGTGRRQQAAFEAPGRVFDFEARAA